MWQICKLKGILFWKTPKPSLSYKIMKYDTLGSLIIGERDGWGVGISGGGSEIFLEVSKRWLK